MRNQLTRNQAVKLVGEKAIKSVERANAEPTNRVGYSGVGGDLIEWLSREKTTDRYGESCAVSVYYYTTVEEVDAVGGDLSNIDWDGAVSHYTVE